MPGDEVKRIFSPLCKALREFAGGIAGLVLLRMDRGFMVCDLELHIRVGGKKPYSMTYHPLRAGVVKWKPEGMPSKEKRALMAKIEKEFLGAIKKFSGERGKFVRIHKAAVDAVNKKITLEGYFGDIKLSELTPDEIEMIDEGALRPARNIFEPLRSAITDCSNKIPDVTNLWYRKVGCSIKIGGKEPRRLPYVISRNKKLSWNRHLRPDKRLTAVVVDFSERMSECVAGFEKKYENVFSIDEVHLDAVTGKFSAGAWYVLEIGLV